MTENEASSPDLSNGDAGDKSEIWGHDFNSISILIGILCLVMCQIQFVYTVFYMCNVSKLTDKILDVIDIRSSYISVEYHMKMVAYTTLCLYIIFLQFDMFTSVLLIMGIQKKKSLMVLPWLINKAFAIAMKLCLSVCMFISCSISSAKTQTQFFFALYIFIGVISAWMWICILIVYLGMQQVEASTK